MTDSTITVHDPNTGQPKHFPLADFDFLFSEVISDGPCRLWCFLRFQPPSADKLLLVQDDPVELRERIAAARTATAVAEER